MSVNLFLDANILLSFYALSDADISKLNELHRAVKRKDVTLYINEQLAEEVTRNRDSKIKESIKTLKENRFKCTAPAFVKLMPKFESLQNILNDANKLHSSLLDEVTQLIEDEELHADNLIKEILSHTGVRQTTPEQFERAHQRFLKGQAPGKKKNTIGDEINWEFLLECVPNREDLHLISSDGDFCSAIDTSRANPALKREWQAKKNSTLHYYQDLNSFFKLYFPNIKLANQERLDALISELSASGSFWRTHEIIAKFPEDPDFTDNQIRTLAEIRENNSQVCRIRDDADVRDFFAPVLAKLDDINKEDEIPF